MLSCPSVPVACTRIALGGTGSHAWRRPAAVLAVVIWVTATGCSPAFGATGHSFLSALTAAGGSGLVEPVAVGVDHADGHVFVSDEGVGVVDVYDAAGKYLTQFGGGELDAVGIAVDEATGAVYVADGFEDEVFVFEPRGAQYLLVGEWNGESLPGGGFGEVTGVAVDNSAGPSSGDVYVVDAEDEELDVGVADLFRPRPSGPEEGQEGELVRVLSKGRMEEPNGIALDPESGRVYVADQAKGAVYEYSDTGTYEGKMNGSSSPQGSFYGKEEEEGNVTGVAVDPVSHDLLVAEGERDQIAEFSAAGEWVGWIPSLVEAPLVEPHGVAVGATGELYVADAGLARVDVYGRGTSVPGVITEKASKPSRTTATLSGVVDGVGKAGRYFFQYGPSEALGSSTDPVAFSGGAEPASTTLEGLTAGSSYFFRLVAENENGASYGIIHELKTSPAVEKVSTGPVKNLLPESRHSYGVVVPERVRCALLLPVGHERQLRPRRAPLRPGSTLGPRKARRAAEAELAALAPNTHLPLSDRGDEQLRHDVRSRTRNSRHPGRRGSSTKPGHRDRP